MEFVAACEAQLSIRIPTRSLGLRDLATVSSFAAAAAAVALPDGPRAWFDIKIPDELSGNRIALLLRLRSRLPASAILRNGADSDRIMVGLPLPLAEDREASLRRILALIGERVD